VNSTTSAAGSERWFSVRPRFLLGCVPVILALILPGVIAHSFILKRVVLGMAAGAIVAGWFFLLRDGGPGAAWRDAISVVTSVYLVVSLPVFLFQMSQWKWFVRHPWHHWLSMYAHPWVHWGIIFVSLGVIGSSFGRGRARVAFLTGAVLLMELFLATATWVF